MPPRLQPTRCTGRPPACFETSSIGGGHDLLDPVLDAEGAVLERHLAVLDEVRRPAGLDEVLDQRAAAAQVEAERRRRERRHQQHRVALLARGGRRAGSGRPPAARPRRSGCAASAAGRRVPRRGPCAPRCWPPRRPGRAWAPGSFGAPRKRECSERLSWVEIHATNGSPGPRAGIDSRFVRRLDNATMKWTRVAAGAAAVVGAVAAHDLTQKKHAILRNFPIIGHLRFTLERFGPELRQYIVTSNDEERPFSRDQRTLGLRLGEGGEQLLRVRHRQRRRARRGLPDHQAPDLRRPGRADRPARRGERAAADGQGARRGARPGRTRSARHRWSTSRG